MASSISDIDNSIRLYTEKIEERRRFVTNANLLISDAQKASDELINASDNLALGLTIGGQSVDGGKFSSMSSTLKSNISTLQSSITVAANEMKNFSDRIVNLQAERRRLVEAERAAAAAAAAKKRREDADDNRSLNKSSSSASRPLARQVTYVSGGGNANRRNEVE